jgi:hypothetical protein
VDNIDLNVMVENLCTTEQVYQEIQNSLYMWGDLLVL